MKECYYAILGLERKADDDSIKKAYRQLALRNHPDKQPEEQREAATARFQLIVEAYECLSDKQERAWYDDHREQILRGGDGTNEGSGSFSTKNEIWKYYSTSCFNGRFDDGAGGFYKTYTELFEELAGLERDDFGSDSEDNDDFSSNLPSFGDSKSEWEDVQTFYSRWGNFQSSRHFRGFDKWDLREGENRQVRRAMEAENKKARNVARKEYSTAVRNLVSFVKRRDKRVVDFQAKQAEKDRLMKEEKEKQAKEKDAMKKLARQAAREEDMRRWEEIELLKLEASSSSESDSEQESQPELFCVACRKTFKSEKAFENHEKSKKHKLEVEKLRAELLLDDEVIDTSPPPEEIVTEEKEPAPKKKQSKKNRKKGFQEEDLTAPEMFFPASDFEDVVTEKKKASKGRRRAVKESPVVVNEKLAPSDSEDVEVSGKTKASKGRRRAVKEAAPGNACKKCGESFPSKSALFRHLDLAGHHALRS